MLNPFDPDSYMIRAEIYILEIEPRITRTLELPKTLNMAQFHEVLQAAFGWTDSHLHQFNIGGVIYGAPEFDEDGLADHRTFEATELRMIDFVFPHYPEVPKITVRYEYDFGDNWRHQIEMQQLPRPTRGASPQAVQDRLKMSAAHTAMQIFSRHGTIPRMMSTSQSAVGPVVNLTPRPAISWR